MNATGIMRELNIVGAHFLDLMPKISIMAKTDLPILITGETGTGKELTAKLIHRLSSRRKKGITFINVPAITDSLFESEIFGHAKGSFTDASKNRPGAIKATRGGTIVLDEIGNMTPNAQSKFLRWLENGEIKAVGSDRIECVDVRIIASTNQNLELLIEKGQFRLDLYHRLTAFCVELKPLRKDITVILDMAKHFVDKNQELFIDNYGNALQISGSELNELFHTLQEGIKSCSNFLSGNARDLETLVRQWLLTKTLQACDTNSPISINDATKKDAPSHTHTPKPHHNQLVSDTQDDTGHINTKETPQIKNTQRDDKPLIDYSFNGDLLDINDNLYPEGMRLRELLQKTIAHFQEKAIRTAFNFYHGDKKKTAVTLELSLHKLNKMLTEYNITNYIPLDETAKKNLEFQGLHKIKIEEERFFILQLLKMGVKQKTIAKLMEISLSTLTNRLLSEK